MKRLLALLAVLFSVLGAGAATPGTIITATITITNAPTTNGMTITVNTDVRTWTNSVSIPATQILTNLTAAGSATNLFNAVSDSPFLNLRLAQLTNGITLQTLTVNGPMVVSLSAGWGQVVLSTNTLTSAMVVRVPLTVEYSTNQTNIATYLAQGFESSTYSISGGAPVLTNYVGLTNAQTITGAKRILSPYLTNETGVNGFYSSPTLTNGINYGNAFSSRGTNTGSEQFGSSATASGSGANAFGSGASASGDGSLSLGQTTIASGIYALAVGYGAQATQDKASAIGNLSTASGTNSTAVGFGALSGGVSSSALGNSANSAGSNSVAIGQGASSAYANSTAIGQGSTTAAADQVSIGRSTQQVLIPGWLAVSNGLAIGAGITNSTFVGTNQFPTGSDIAFKRYALSSLANGNNAAVPVGTNIFIEVSGPSGAFTINGIAGGRDGKFIILLNRTGQTLTIAHDSGTDPTAANRVYTLTAADKTVAGNSAAQLIYNANVSRWILLNFTQ